MRRASAEREGARRNSVVGVHRSLTALGEDNPLLKSPAAILGRLAGGGARQTPDPRAGTTLRLVARQPSPHAEQLTASVCELAQASLRDDGARVAELLAQIGHRVAEIERRVNVPRAEQVRIYRRDSWTCRYCGLRTVPIPVLRVISSRYPDQFPHHPNWKAGHYHPAYLLVSTSLDHVHPRGRGGASSDQSNLVTACWPCNSGKADFTLDELGWQLLGVGRPYRLLPPALVACREARREVPPPFGCGCCRICGKGSDGLRRAEARTTSSSSSATCNGGCRHSPSSRRAVRLIPTTIRKSPQSRSRPDRR
jgi:5-methylcytosine-specific restriction endonuclease McrA